MGILKNCMYLIMFSFHTLLASISRLVQQIDTTVEQIINIIQSQVIYEMDDQTMSL